MIICSTNTGTGPLSIFVPKTYTLSGLKKCVGLTGLNNGVMQFRDVIGHDHIKGQLTANVRAGRISHAQLFLGPDDSGTLAIALAYARFILCHDRGEDDACGKCPSCLKFSKLAHPDLHFFFPSSPNQEHKKDVSSKLFLPRWREILLETPYFTYRQWLEHLGIENKQAIINAEDCNDIIRTLGLKAYEGKYKIIFMYMTEKLYYAAAPKLLKVLEEPPANTLFLMVAENKDLVLNTILSRTQILKVPRPSEDEVSQALQEMTGTEPVRAKQIAFLADGSVSEALRLVKHGGEVMADFDSFREWMRYCYKKDTSRIIKWAEGASRRGREKQKSFFQYGLKIFRLCLLHNYDAGSLIRLEGEEKDFISKFAPFINHHNAIQIVTAFNTAITHLERNANPKILFTDLSFQLVRLMHR